MKEILLWLVIKIIASTDEYMTIRIQKVFYFCSWLPVVILSQLAFYCLIYYMMHFVQYICSAHSWWIQSFLSATSLLSGDEIDVVDCTHKKNNIYFVVTLKSLVLLQVALKLFIKLYFLLFNSWTVSLGESPSDKPKTTNMVHTLNSTQRHLHHQKIHSLRWNKA